MQDGIAIIGMSGKFPKAKNIQEFWDNIAQGVEGITFYSDEELLEAGIAREVLDDPRYIKAKGEVAGIDLFDAHFFGYTPREAELMDPQHRLFLECAWEAMEDAGYDPERIDGRVGVFAGESLSTYMILNVVPNFDTNYASAGSLQAAIGNDKDSLTTTLTYKMDLRGAGITIQSSSSTSLVAVSMACQSLINYQCDMILAGGVSVGSPKKNGYLFEEAGIVSPDGHCRPYDAEGHGFVPGTGVGVVLLKRLDEALEDGDHIYAAIKGFAVNNDGAKKVSYSAPSADAQAEVIMEAQKYAGFPPETISYVEGHGTATKLGDVIEVSALKRAFGDNVGKNFCALGSVKSNIGHLDTAAGVTGLIKAALCIEKKQIPPTINYQKANPQLGLEDSPFFVPTALMDWNPTGKRRAGVSSFGMGGTNAHVVLEEVEQNMQNPLDERVWKLVTLSAKTEAALSRHIKNTMEFMENKEALDLSSLAYTSQVGRKRLDKRAVILLCKTMACETGLVDSGAIKIIKGQVKQEKREVVFLFPGQGAQYLNMGRELYELEPVFKHAVDLCSDLFEAYLGEGICDFIFGDQRDIEKHERLMGDTSVAQPAIFTVEYAMAKLLNAWGITPDAVIGHSMGELTAACISGLINLEDAVKLIAHRGRLMETMPEGAMISAAITPEDAMQLAGKYPDISLAAVNGPMACVFSGCSQAVGQMEEDFASQGILCSRLKNKHAFHSANVECIKDEFCSVLNEVSMVEPDVRCISNVDGGYFDHEKIADKEYWLRHLRGTVHFMRGIQTLQDSGEKIYIEVGPGKTLNSLVGQILGGDRDDLLSTIPHYNDLTGGQEYLAAALGKLWILGVEIDWNSYYQGRKFRRISFPTYPFERKSYWLESPGLRKIKGKSWKVELQDEEQDIQERIENRPEISTTFVRPTQEMEKRVALVWERLLGIQPIGLDDSFFELGGNSLGITQMFSRIYSEFKVKVDYRAFYSCPTVRTITEMISDIPEQSKDKPMSDDAKLEALLSEIEAMSDEETREMLSGLYDDRG